VLAIMASMSGGDFLKKKFNAIITEGTATNITRNTKIKKSDITNVLN